MSPKHYPIGTRYWTRGQHPRLCTVIDIWRTYNNANELVRVRYVTEHEIAGQTVTEHDVVATTIARGMFAECSARQPQV